MFSRPVSSHTGQRRPDQRRDASAHSHAAPRRAGDVRKQLEQRALACAIVADDSDNLALLDRQRHVVQRQERLALHRCSAREPSQPIGGRFLERRRLAEPELLRYVSDVDDGHGQTTSAK
jgi:hypothetical protein